MELLFNKTMNLVLIFALLCYSFTQKCYLLVRGYQLSLPKPSPSDTITPLLPALEHP